LSVWEHRESRERACVWAPSGVLRAVCGKKTTQNETITISGCRTSRPVQSPSSSRSQSRSPRRSGKPSASATATR